MSRKFLLLLALLALTAAEPSAAALAAKAGSAFLEEKAAGTRKEQRKALSGDRFGTTATTDVMDWNGDLTRGWDEESLRARQKALELRRVEKQIKATLSEGPLSRGTTLRRLLEEKAALENEMDRLAGRKN